MKIIAHRGNISGPHEELENSHNYIDSAIQKGLDVEIDVWQKDNELFLGHDEPKYPVNLKWIKDREKHLWVHIKNINAVTSFFNTNIKFFYHKEEDHTLIGNSQYIWSHDIEKALESISIIPAISFEDIVTNLRVLGKERLYNMAGVCTDYVEILPKKK